MVVINLISREFSEECYTDDDPVCTKMNENLIFCLREPGSSILDIYLSIKTRNILDEASKKVA
jgi:hypothetical protein